MVILFFRKTKFTYCFNFSSRSRVDKLERSAITISFFFLTSEGVRRSNILNYIYKSFKSLQWFFRHHFHINIPISLEAKADESDVACNHHHHLRKVIKLLVLKAVLRLSAESF